MRRKDPSELTRRQRAVVAAILDGYTSNELIAAKLGISVRTVATHLNRIYDKIGARDRAHLVLLMSAQAQPCVTAESVAEQSVIVTAQMLLTTLDRCQLERLIELLTVKMERQTNGRNQHCTLVCG